MLCMDNLRTGSLANLTSFADDPAFEYVEHDVTTYIDVPGELDEIYHFASPASPADFERIPIPILKVGPWEPTILWGSPRQRGRE